jgi:hypothetical protein
MTPDEWAHIRSIAKWVLPVLVGPRIARTAGGAAPRRWRRWSRGVAACPAARSRCRPGRQRPKGPDQARQEEALASGPVGRLDHRPPHERRTARPADRRGAGAPVARAQPDRVAGRRPCPLLERNGARTADALQAAALVRAKRRCRARHHAALRLGAPDGGGQRGDRAAALSRPARPRTGGERGARAAG